jgi:cob(I)alamin adenosyltransferase
MLYTKTGDAGETGLFDGTRVSKADARVAACGDVDELNAWLGLVRARNGGAELDEILVQLQRDLFALGARIADPRHRIATRVQKVLIDQVSIARLEHWIDALDAPLPPLRKFLLAGGSEVGASLHVARTVCRRAERSVVGLGTDAVEPIVLVYINRLSDLLFVMARTANERAGIVEIEW